jgi:hypothetical protein
MKFTARTKYRSATLTRKSIIYDYIDPLEVFEEAENIDPL